MIDNEEGLRAAEQLTKAIASLERQEILDLYWDDAEIWHNTTNKIQNKSENANLLDSIFSLVSELAYHNIVREPTSTGFLQYHTLRGRFKDGTPIPELHACIVGLVANGKITRINEWLDSSQWAEMWKLLEAPLTA